MHGWQQPARPEAAYDAAQAALSLVGDGDGRAFMAALVAARRRARLLAAQVSVALVESFVTSLEREDVVAVNAALYVIPRTVERFAERYRLVVGRLEGIDFCERVDVLARRASTVAETIAESLIDTRAIAQRALFLGSALASACIWNLLTWWLGLPSSSSHGLVGGMIGAALAASSGQWHSVIWWLPQEHWWQTAGVFPKVILPMIASPVVGFLAAFVFMGGLYFFLSWCAQRTGIFRKLGRTPFVSAFFGKAQIVSAVGMGLSHGMNDAQKTMGIVALALAGANAGGTLDELPQWLGFLRLPDATGGGLHIPAWVVVLCALTMAAGTAAGGWRIIRTLGHRLVHLHPVNGFAAETGSALVIAGASIAGIPLSTTHCVSSAIMGVGAAKRFSAIRWPLVRRMAWAWIFTLPATALLGWLIFMVAGVF